MKNIGRGTNERLKSCVPLPSFLLALVSGTEADIETCFMMLRKAPYVSQPLAAAFDSGYIIPSLQGYL